MEFALEEIEKSLSNMNDADLNLMADNLQRIASFCKSEMLKQALARRLEQLSKRLGVEGKRPMRTMLPPPCPQA